LDGMALPPKDQLLYECAVLVTSDAEEDILGLAQLCRDRGDAESVFDELKE
jgi:hypothetical protein